MMSNDLQQARIEAALNGFYETEHKQAGWARPFVRTAGLENWSPQSIARMEAALAAADALEACRNDTESGTVLTSSGRQFRGGLVGRLDEAALIEVVAKARGEAADAHLPSVEQIAEVIAGHPIGSGFYQTTVGVGEAREMAEAVRALFGEVAGDENDSL